MSQDLNQVTITGRVSSRPSTHHMPRDVVKAMVDVSIYEAGRSNKVFITTVKVIGWQELAAKIAILQLRDEVMVAGKIITVTEGGVHKNVILAQRLCVIKEAAHAQDRVVSTEDAPSGGGEAGA